MLRCLHARSRDSIISHNKTIIEYFSFLDWITDRCVMRRRCAQMFYVFCTFVWRRRCIACGWNQRRDIRWYLLCTVWTNLLMLAHANSGHTCECKNLSMALSLSLLLPHCLKLLTFPGIYSRAACSFLIYWSHCWPFLVEHEVPYSCCGATLRFHLHIRMMNSTK